MAEVLVTLGGDHGVYALANLFRYRPVPGQGTGVHSGWAAFNRAWLAKAARMVGRGARLLLTKGLLSVKDLGNSHWPVRTLARAERRA